MVFETLEWLDGTEAASLDHAELEQDFERRRREMQRRMLQDHLDLRAVREAESRLPAPTAWSTDTMEAGHCRSLTTVFGTVTVERLAYRHRGVGAQPASRRRGAQPSRREALPRPAPTGRHRVDPGLVRRRRRSTGASSPRAIPPPRPGYAKEPSLRWKVGARSPPAYVGGPPRPGSPSPSARKPTRSRSTLSTGRLPRRPDSPGRRLTNRHRRDRRHVSILGGRSDGHHRRTLERRRRRGRAQATGTPMQRRLRFVLPLASRPGTTTCARISLRGRGRPARRVDHS